MRKLSYKLSYLITKLLNETHSFRYLLYYKLQIYINTVWAIFLTFFVAYLFNTTLQTLILTIVFFIIKPFLDKHYHATSYMSCEIISIIFIMIPSLLYKYSGDFSVSVSLLLLMMLLSTTDRGQEIMDIMSHTIDDIYKKTRKAIICVKNSRK